MLRYLWKIVNCFQKYLFSCFFFLLFPLGSVICYCSCFLQFLFLFLSLFTCLFSLFFCFCFFLVPVPILIRVSVFSRFFFILSSSFPDSYCFYSCILQFLSCFSNSCFNLKLLFLFTYFLFLLSKVTVFFSLGHFISCFIWLPFFSSFCSLSSVLFSCHVIVLFWSSPLLFPLVFFFYFSSSCFCLSSFCFCLSSSFLFIQFFPVKLDPFSFSISFFCFSSSCFCLSSSCFCLSSSGFCFSSPCFC